VMAPEDSEVMPSLRVLIVEDNRDAAEMLNSMLVTWGQETRIAYDGQEGLQAAAEFLPHVVLLDIGLPQLNGYDVARRIREESWGGQMALVALTGWGQDADRQRSKAAGIDLHLIKPIEPAALKNVLAGFQNRPVIRTSRGETSQSVA